MPDYSKNQNYKLHDNITGEDYYGHTTQTLASRLGKHISNANDATISQPCTSRQIIKRGDFEMIHLEYFPCANRKEAEARERWWIENQECVNTQIPGRTYKEWRQDNKEELDAKKKAYREANKATINARHKVWREANKEELVVRNKVYNKANKEAISARKKVYNKANKEAISARMKAYREWNRDMQGLNKIDITD